MTRDPATLGDEGRRGLDWRRVLLALVLLGGLAAFFLLGGPRWLRLDTLQANRARLLDYAGRHYLVMLLTAAAVYALAAAFSIPGAVVLSLAVGFVFGPWVGTAVVVVGATLGATLAFLAARYLFADAARRRAGPRVQRLMEGFERDGFNYMLFVRLVPLFPFWLVNLVPAFTGLRTRTFVAATALGIIPGSFVYCYLGARLATLRRGSDLYRDPRWLLAFALLALLALVPVLWRRFRRSPRSGAPT